MCGITDAFDRCLKFYVEADASKRLNKNLEAIKSKYSQLKAEICPENVDSVGKFISSQLTLMQKIEKGLGGLGKKHTTAIKNALAKLDIIERMPASDVSSMAALKEFVTNMESWTQIHASNLGQAKAALDGFDWESWKGSAKDGVGSAKKLIEQRIGQWEQYETQYQEMVENDNAAMDEEGGMTPIARFDASIQVGRDWLCHMADVNCDVESGDSYVNEQKNEVDAEMEAVQNDDYANIANDLLLRIQSELKLKGEKNKKCIAQKLP